MSGAQTAGGSVFSGCAALANVTFGSGLTNLGNDIFNACTTISVTIGAATPPSTGSRLTNSAGVFNPTFYVPEASLDAYKAASVWSNYADHILAIP